MNHDGELAAEDFVGREYVGERFDRADPSDLEMDGCAFVRCSFGGTVLSSVLTGGCSFESCDSTDARLNGSEHRGSAFLNCAFRGASLFSAEFSGCKLVGADLEEADLTAFTVSGGDLSYANVAEKGDLNGQDLKGGKFVQAELAEKADLSGAGPGGADLGRATRSRARLEGADLRGTNLDGVDLSAHDLRGVRPDVEQAVLLARSHGAEVDLGA